MSFLQRNAPPTTDHEEFRALFESECAYVVHTLRRLGVPAGDSADVAHEVFMIVLRQLPECDRSRPMRPWIFGITLRVARDYRRLARVRLEVHQEIEAADESPAADDALHLLRRQQLVLDALEAIDLERRAVLVMHDIDGYTMPEIASVLGIPLNTGYSRLRLARTEFEASIKRRRSHDEH